MSDFINTIDILGDDILSDSIIERTIEEFADNTIIELKSFAFVGFDNLYFASLPSIKEVSNNAFNGCTRLTSVNFPNVTSIGNYAFNYCRNLTSVNTPNVTSIGFGAFSACKSLTSVNFPNVTSISGRAFNYCTLLQNVNLPNVTSIGYEAFNDCALLQNVNLPNVTSIGDNTFSSCYNLTSVNMPNVTSISGRAFRFCRSLTSIDFPNVTILGNNAFSACYNLTSVNTPNVTSIGYEAFKQCTSLTSIDFPNVTILGHNAFDSTVNLASVNMPNLISINNGGAFNNCRSLISANFPNLTSIGREEFSFCYNLTSVNTPNVTSIGNNAFNYCYNLASVNFPNVTSLGNGAFNYCSGLRTIDLLSTVTFNAQAFFNCRNLTSLILRSNELCTLKATNVFTSTPIGNKTNGYIYVPNSTINNYKNATNWSTYSNRFRVLEDHTIGGTTTGLIALEIQDDWTTIMNVVNNGSYKYKYSVGSYKPLDLGDEGIVNMQIVAMDTDELSDGTGTAAVTWVARDLLATKHRMNPALASTTDDAGNTVYTEGTGTIGGWEKSELRGYLKETIKPLIQTDILATIVKVSRTHNARNTADDAFTQTTSDDVWILGRNEIITGDYTYTLCYPDATSKIKSLPSGTATDWWLRDADNQTFFAGIDTGGSQIGKASTTEIGIALGFCTGKTK